MSDHKTPIERPIIFSGAMVKAILEGRKSQTRRAVKITHRSPGLAACLEPPHGMAPRPQVAMELCPFGQPGDRLWLRENGWERPECSARDMREGADTWMRYHYDADGVGDADHEQFKAWGFKRRPSIYMPRWASRITLEIEDVRVERLQDISEDDAKAEGVTPFPYDPDGDCWTAASPERAHRTAFERLWGEINRWGGEPRARAPWASNPWVWCVSFRRVPEKGL